MRTWQVLSSGRRLGKMAAAACLCVVATAIASPAVAEGDTLTAAVRGYVHAGEVVYVEDSAGEPVVAIDAERHFVPASTLKVFTALLARDHLGLDHRFATEFHLAGGWLVVRGYGDPLLVSEELTTIANELAGRLGTAELVGIAIDDSYFAENLDIPGVGASNNPYDACNSALAVNFNTVNVRRNGDRVVSLEPQTPVTPLVVRVARERGLVGADRISIGHSQSDVRRYAAELIGAKLREAGVRVGDGFAVRRAPDAKPFYVHQSSRTVGEVVASMLQYSNNYIANQLFLAVGAAVEGPPATLAKSVAVARRYVDAHPHLRGLVVTEGSGIARSNRADARALAAVLASFAPQSELLRLEHGVRHKTGTLSDVRSIVGYLRTRRHGTVRFVIAMDGGGHVRRWQVVDLLRKRL